MDELQCSAICPPFVVYGIGSASFPPIHSTLTLLSFKPTLSDSPMSGMLTPDSQEKIIGLAEVKDVFSSPKFGDVAGSIVTEGVVRQLWMEL